MNRRICVLLAWVCLGPLLAARAEQIAPRDVWPQATSAMDAGDAATAAKKTSALFVRHGRAAAHDFREILGQRISGGSVTVLAVALLFLPIFLWLGPMWLLLYWLVIFFGYANKMERTLILALALLVAAAPVALDLVANRVAGVESPVLQAAIASQERAYYPDALRRLQDLVNVLPDRPLLHLLLGNLEVM